jgi:hypothetical protein
LATVVDFLNRRLFIKAVPAILSLYYPQVSTELPLINAFGKDCSWPGIPGLFWLPFL